MESLCRLCAKEKPPKQLAYYIDDPSLNIEQKLIHCCGWNLLITNEIQSIELPKKICRVCLRYLESSWAFAEIVAQAQEQLFALMADIKPELPIIEYVNVNGENDETNEYFEDIKFESSVLGIEMDSVSSVMDENKPEFSLLERDHNQKRNETDRGVRPVNLSTLMRDNTPFEIIEPSEGIEAFQSRNTQISRFESDFTSNEPDEIHLEVSETDLNKQRVCKTDYIPKCIRRTMLVHFKQQKTAAASHRLLTQTYGHLTPSLKTYRKWLKRFKAGDSELMEQYGRSKKFRDVELQALLEENPSRSTRDLSQIIGVTRHTIWKRLHTIGKIYVDGKWIAKNNENGLPIELSESIEPIEEIVDFSNCNSPISGFESDSTSNNPVEAHLQLSERDFENKRGPKTPYIPKRIRQMMFQYFKQNKTAAESRRLLAQSFGHMTPSLTTCKKWFGRFKAGDSNLKERHGRPKKFGDTKLQALLDENPVRSLQELSDIIGVTKPTIWQRLQKIGRIYDNGKWIEKNEKIPQTASK